MGFIPGMQKSVNGQVWWYMLIILALGGLRREDQKF
jgi:hypothetical protein